jgi:hypothetical protein
LREAVRRPIMSGLGQGSISLVGGNLFDEDASTPILVIRGLRGGEFIDDVMKIMILI